MNKAPTLIVKLIFKAKQKTRVCRHLSKAREVLDFGNMLTKHIAYFYIILCRRICYFPIFTKLQCYAKNVVSIFMECIIASFEAYILRDEKKAIRPTASPTTFINEYALLFNRCRQAILK